MILRQVGRRYVVYDDDLKLVITSRCKSICISHVQDLKRIGRKNVTPPKNTGKRQ